jgi:hypothetical protein
VPPQHSASSLPAIRSPQIPLKNSQNVSQQANPVVLAIPDAQAKYQMFAGYNQAEQMGQKALLDATAETSKAKMAQAAAEEQLRSHLVNPQLPAILPPVLPAILPPAKPAAGIRKRPPSVINQADNINIVERVVIEPLTPLDVKDSESVKRYDRFFNNLPDNVKAIVRSKVFNDASKVKLRVAVKLGFRDWAVKFFANGPDGRNKLSNTKYFKDGTKIAPPRKAEIPIINEFLDNLRDLYLHFLIVWANQYGENKLFKEDAKTFMDTNSDQVLIQIIHAYMGQYAYQNHSTLRIDLEEQLGRGNEGTGLSSAEIMHVMKDSNAFRGVYPVDLIKAINLLKKKPSSAIINTDVAAGDGLHWVSIFCDPIKRTFEYYDPFGEPPTMEMSADFAKLIKDKFKPSRNGFQMKNNLIREQDNKTDTCGVHAMRFITRREQGVPFKQSTPYFQSMEADAQDDIEKIRALPKFGYVNKK